jgi:hypothetical protein
LQSNASTPTSSAIRFVTINPAGTINYDTAYIWVQIFGN